MRLLNTGLHSALTITLSWTLATGPLVAIPQVAVAQESDFSKAFNLTEDLNKLLERAAYPNVPRRGPQGPPTTGEMAEAQVRLYALKASLQQTFYSRILQAGNEQAQIDLLKELEKYFQAVSRYEGLKIMIGQPTDPDTWETVYNFKFPLKDLSQGKFLETASTYAQSAVLLPVEGADREQVQKDIAEGSFFITHIEPSEGIWYLTFRLNPKFAAESERFSFLTRPSLKAGLQFAAHFSMHRLYDSLIVTRAMRMQMPDTLPAPPKAAQDRYLSMKVARFQAVNGYQRALDRIIKPNLYKSLLDAAELSKVHALTNEFYAGMAAIKKLPPRPLSAEELAEIHKEEIVKFAHALSTLLNLTEITDWKSVPQFYIKESKRLALRSALIGDETARAGLDQKDIPALEQLIEKAADQYASEVIAKSPKLAEQVKEYSETGMRKFTLSLRVEFQRKLEKAALDLRDYRKKDMFPPFIYGAQASNIKALEPSESTEKLAKKLSESQLYIMAYAQFKAALGSLLREFLYKGQPVQDIGIDKLTRLVPKMTWNPDALKGKIPDAYIKTFNKQPTKGWIEQLVDLTPPSIQNRMRWTGFTPSSRQKELIDVLTVGRLFKFNVFETLDGKPPTVENLKLDDTFLGPLTQTENKAYLEEVKKVLINESPLLGGVPINSDLSQLNDPSLLAGVSESQPSGKMVWEYLADDKLSDRRKIEIVTSQLAVVEEKIHANEKSVAEQLAKIDAIEGEDVSKLSDDMKVIASRAYQISSGLEQYASFSEFYQKMRSQLISPGLARLEWERFSTFANESMTYMLVFMVASLVGSRAGPVGKMGDSVGRLLAPLCGPNFKCVNPLFLTLIGASLSDQLVRGFGTEAQNLEVLRRYFECGSDGPCVAVYTDIKQQTDVMMMPRYQALATVVQIATIMGFFLGARKLIGYFSTPRFSEIDLFKRDMNTLGMNETASLSRESLQVAARDSLVKVRQQTDVMARMQGEALVMQSYARLESTLHNEAGKWVGFELRYRDLFEKVGLNKSNWVDPNALAQALKQVQFRYKNGQLLRSDYQEQMGALMSAYQKLAPVWTEIEKNPMLANYYRRAWNLANTNSDVSITQMASSFNSKVSSQFMKAMNEFYGTNGNGQIDDVLQNIANEIKNSPTLHAGRVEQLKRMLEKGAQ